MTVFVSDTLQVTAGLTTGDPTPVNNWQWTKDGAVISGATNATYVATTADTGTTLSVIQTAINIMGSASRTSAATGPVLPFDPISLFRNNTQGVFYDVNLTDGVLFQDSAGTTPVTAVEQPVGLMLDKSKNGVGTNGAARYNLLTRTEQFNDAAWVKANATIASTGYTDPLGGTNARLMLETTANLTHIVRQNISWAATTYTHKVYVKAEGRTWTAIQSKDTAVYFDLQNIAVGNVGTATNVSIVDAGNGWRLCSFNAVATAGAGDFVIYAALSNGVVSYTGDVTKGIYIFGVDLRLASDAAKLPVYQRITDTWYNTLPGNHAFQTTSASRPVLSARVNQYLATETLATQNVTTVATSYRLRFEGAGTITLSGTATGTYSAGTHTITCTAGDAHIHGVWHSDESRPPSLQRRRRLTPIPASQHSD